MRKTEKTYTTGRIDVLNEMSVFVENQIQKIKIKETTPNTPRQITNGGQLKAYNLMLQKIRLKKDRAIDYKQNQQQ